MKKFTNVIKAFSFFVFAFMVGTTVFAQTPGYIGTDIADGNYIHIVFPTVGNISSQYRVQATSSAALGVRKLEFTANASYTNVWRAYSSIGDTITTFGTILDPTTQTASARYNSGFGGQTLKLPAITAGNYYTVNIMTNRTNHDDTMAVLETSYNPVVISSVSQSPLAAAVTSNCMVTVTATLAAAPSAGEYIYLRYSTVAFGNASTCVQMNVVGTTATANIPSLPGGSNVQYYVFSSPVNGLIANGQASGYYDCLSLNYNNNGNLNYSYNITAAAAPSVSIAATQPGVCPTAFIADTFIATSVNQGTMATYQWYKNGVAVAAATTDTLIDGAISGTDSVWVVMTPGADVTCPQPYSSNHLILTTLPITYDSVTATASSLTYCNAIGMDTFIAIPNNGGTAPNYQWIINEIPVATGDTFITNAFSAGDNIAVLMTPTSLACPSQVPARSNNINVSLFGTDSFTQNISICQGGSYMINGHTYTTTNTYRDTFFAASVTGCDSVVVTNLTANPLPTGTASASQSTFCLGDSAFAIVVPSDPNDTVSWYDASAGGTLLGMGDSLVLKPAVSGADTVYAELKSVAGCTGAARLMVNISVTAPTSFVQFDTICSNSSVIVGAHTYNTTGTFTDTLFNASASGCDSVVTTNLYVKQPSAFTQYDTICQGASFTVNGHAYSATNTYNDTLTGAAGNGCDSIIITNLTVEPLPASGVLTPNTAPGNVCDGANVSATATAGSGGTGTIADSLQYRYDGGAWQTYTSGSSLSTTGHTSVDIQTYCTATGSGCTTSSPNIVSWNIVAQPVAGSLTGTPFPGNVCDGVMVSASLTAGTGGAGTVTDSVQYNYDGGAWLDYASGTNISTTGHTSVSIRTFRTATGAGCNRSSDSTIIWTINPNPTNNIGNGPISQCGGNVMLDAGNLGSTYIWSDGSTNEIDTISTTATYSVTVTTAFSCTAIFSRNIFIKPVPIVNLGADQSLCGGTTTLDAGNPGDIYSWTGGSTGQLLTVSTSGTYIVTVTDSSSHCTASDSVQITINTPPTVSLGPDTSLCGGSLILDAGNVGGTYHWNDNSTAQTLTVSATGNYSVTVTDANLCTAIGSRLVTINSQPNLGADVTDSICPSSTADLNNYYQGSGLTLSYNTANPAMVAPGTYTVVGTNNSGCTDTAMINITTRLAPSAGPDMVDSVCIGSTANLTLLIPNSGFATYNWNTASPQNALPGVYQLVVSNGSGCTDTAMVTVLNRVPQPSINLGHDTTQCGGTINLLAEIPGGTYLWSDGSTSYQLAVGSTGIYSVTVTNPNGCSATDQILVTIYQKPNLGADVTDSICPGSRADLYNYYLNSGLTLIYNSITPSSVDSGTYTVIGTNSNGCMDTAMISIIYRQKPNAGGAKTDSICPGYKYDLTALYPNIGYTSYTWNTANATAVDTGTYMLVVSNASGCYDTAIAAITQRMKPNLGGNKTDSICIGYTYDLRTLYPDSNIYISYVWNTANDSAVTAGVYQLIVTNASGCTDTAYATITFKMRPVVTLPAYPNVCITNPSFQLTGGMPLGGVYHINNVADSIFSPAGLGAGTHYVVYVYTNMQGCTDSAIRYITVYPQPVIYDTIALPNLCNGSPLLDLNNYFTPNGGVFSGVGVSGHYFYPNIAALGSDSVTYIYTDMNGCMDTAGRRISIIPSVHVSLHTDQSNLTICQGQSITFTASGAPFYQFFVNDSAVTTRDTTSTFTTTSLNNHDQVTVVGSNYCSSDTSEFIIIDVITLPTVVAGPDTTIDLGQTVQLYAIGTGSSSLVYAWTPDSSLSMVNIPNPIYSGPDTITFQVKVTDANGCSATANVTINVRIPDTIQLPNVITPNGDGKNDMWVLNPKIDLTGSHLVIINRWSEVVFETDNYANNWDGTYKATGHKVPDGTYYYILTVPAQHGHIYRGPIDVLSSGTN